MRITRTRYEIAKKKLSKMERLLDITSRWEQMMEGLSDAVAANVVAIETTKDGTVKVEYGKTDTKIHFIPNQAERSLPNQPEREV